MRKALTTLISIQILALLYVGLSIQKARAVNLACPDATTITADSYQTEYREGFAVGCPRGLENKIDQSSYCEDVGGNNPYSTPTLKALSWRDGCIRGYNEGIAIYTAYMAENPTGESRAQKSCQEYAAAAKANTRYSESQVAEYYGGCMEAYGVIINGSHPSSYCNNFTEGSSKRVGCQAGILIAEAQLLETPLPAPSTENRTAAQAINNCGISLSTSDPNIEKGVIEGCLAGYNQSKKREAMNCPTGNPLESDPRKRIYNAAFSDACKKGFQYFVRPTNSTPTPSDNIKSIVPSCNPELPPSAAGACGVPKLFELIQNIMRYLWYIALPIGALMLGWGGFNIMTAAGNEEKMKTGYGAIKITVIGYGIMLGAYLIVKTIFTVLGVEGFGGLF